MNSFNINRFWNVIQSQIASSSKTILRYIGIILAVNIIRVLYILMAGHDMSLIHNCYLTIIVAPFVVLISQNISLTTNKWYKISYNMTPACKSEKTIANYICNWIIPCLIMTGGILLNLVDWVNMVN